jgi:hypothetical protein
MKFISGPLGFTLPDIEFREVELNSDGLSTLILTPLFFLYYEYPR